MATVAAMVVIHAVTQLGDRGLARVLGMRAPAYLGRGTYLWHWPVILVLREVLDVAPWARAALAAVLATALAALSYELVEHPIRAGVVLRRRPGLSLVADEHDFTLSLNILVGCRWQRDVVGVAGESGSDCERNRSDLYGASSPAAQQPRSPATAASTRRLRPRAA